MKKMLLIALITVSILGMMCSCQTNTEQGSIMSQSSTEVSQTSEVSKMSEVSQESEKSQESEVSEKADSETKIDEILSGNMTGFAAVIKDGEMIYGKGFNKGDDKQQFNSGTVFRIGSDTKQFTAASIMLLQQQGKLSVNDTLEKYFPDCKNGRNITLHNLLTMHSGLTDYSNYFAKLNLTKDETENKAAILKFILAEDLIDPPNGVFTYNNSNYFLLATIIEQVSGMTYEEYLTENIFNPLDMKSTSVYKDYEKDGAVMAKSVCPRGITVVYTLP